jgi:methionyl aminopeptidase
MNIFIKTNEQIKEMRIAGKLAAEVLDMIGSYIVPGMSTEQINTMCHDYIVDVQKAIPAPLNYRGFPKSVCTSVNHVVCHGIPSEKKLKKGDIVNVDVTVIKNGFHGDTSKMYFVGGKSSASIIARRLVNITRECLYKGIDQVKPGNTFLDIARVIQNHAHKHNFSVVEAFCGHGIGKAFHEDPQVLHYIPNSLREREYLSTALEPGMIFTIEPMLNIGRKDVTILKDGWTVVTKDRSLSSQWEHTMAVTSSGCEILTLRQEEISQSII